MATNDKKNSKRQKLAVDRVHSGLSQKELKRYILEVAKEPIVFLNKLSSWKCMEWTPEILAEHLCDVRTQFRFCPRVSSPHFKFNSKKSVMETDCEYSEGTLQDFYTWLKGVDNKEIPAAFRQFPAEDYTCYADYKYMTELFAGYPAMLNDIDWGVMGFPERNGEQSTFWMGTKESFTPCHYDTYGCNLVAQIYGRKKWTLFSHEQTDFLYPTRIPYEESSVFSQVNIRDPDFDVFPNFHSSISYEVTLEPGDVLFVPKHWWHYVESLETSISVNTWIEMESDSFDRIQEAVARTLIHSLKVSEENVDYDASSSSWINPSMRQEEFSFKQNMEYIQQAVHHCLLAFSSSSEDLEKLKTNKVKLHSEDIVNTILSTDVTKVISQKLLQFYSQDRTV